VTIGALVVIVLMPLFTAMLPDSRPPTGQRLAMAICGLFALVACAVFLPAKRQLGASVRTTLTP
jgi:hypothetical protein